MTTAQGLDHPRVTRLLRSSSADDVATAAQLLRRGGLVAFPTDTVYGLGTSVGDAQAVADIFVAKERSPDKAIPVLMAGLNGAEGLAVDLPDEFSTLAALFWPGPLTLVVTASRSLPEIVTASTGTVALRVPDHPVALALLRSAGPLAVSSANRSGWESPVTADEVLAQLDGRIDAVLDGGRCPGGLPSTVIDLTQTPFQVLRRGPIDESEIRTALTRPGNPDSGVRVAS